MSRFPPLLRIKPGDPDPEPGEGDSTGITFPGPGTTGSHSGEPAGSGAVPEPGPETTPQDHGNSHGTGAAPGGGLPAVTLAGRALTARERCLGLARHWAGGIWDSARRCWGRPGGL